MNSLISKVTPAIGLVLVLAIASCGDDKSPPQKSVVNNDQKTDKFSCQYQFDDGEYLDQGAVQANSEIITLSFDKKLNYSPLRAVMSASARNTINYFNTQNVHVYQMPEAVEGCAFFSSIESAPSDFASYWSSQAESVSQKTGGRGKLAGLYIPKDSPEVASSSSHSEIGIRPDSTRWTVVHEFTHHQLDSYRLLQGRSTIQLKQDFKNAVAHLNNIESNPESYTNDDVVTALAKISQFTREMLTDFLLEEVTIETFLQKKYNSGELRYAPFDARSSNAYISKSATAARDDLNELTKALQGVQSKLDESFQRNVLQNEIDQNTSLINRTTATLSETGNDYGGDFSIVAGSEIVEDDDVPLCAHSREAYKLIKELNNKLRKWYN